MIFVRNSKQIKGRKRRKSMLKARPNRKFKSLLGKQRRLLVIFFRGRKTRSHNKNNK